MISTIGLAIASFVATNLDDIFILMLFLADRRFSFRHTIIGHYLGIGILVGLSVLGALVALLIPLEWVRLLGLLPIALGIKQLIDLRRGEEETEALPSESRWSLKFLTVASVTFANGGDNIGVYIPLFASHSSAQVTLMVLVFAIMSALWCAVAFYLVRRTRLGDQMRRFGDRLMPLVLIALGLLILADAF